MSLHVVHVIDSLVASGAETSLASMIGPLAERQVRSTVIHFGRDDGLAAAIRSDGGRVVVGDASNRAVRIRQVRSLISAERADLVHTSLFEADIAGRVGAVGARVPVVSSIVTMQYGPERRAAHGLPRWKVAAAQALDAGTAQSVCRFHAITTAAAEHARAHLGIRRKPIDVIPRGRSNDVMGVRSSERRSRVRAEMDWGETPIVLAAGRHDSQKGLDVLVESIPLLRSDAKVVIAGREGSATEQLRRRIGELGIAERCHILGPRTDLPDLMAGADAFAFPSRWEGLGGALIEAMALELPIVATNLPPIAEVAPADEIALLVPADDHTALARGINVVLDGGYAITERVGMGRRRFEARFEIGRVADQMTAFYQAALERR